MAPAGSPRGAPAPTDITVPDNATQLDAATPQAVEALLRQLVDGRFALIDRDGAVTRWSAPAAQLFWRPASAMSGQGLLETLAIDTSVPDAGGRMMATASRGDGLELELVLTFVPVKMSQSLEFNGFLEALVIVGPGSAGLTRLQQSHRAVVEWIGQAMAGEARLAEDDLSAGTIVVFEPLGEPPPAADPSVPDRVAAALSAAAANASAAVSPLQVAEVERALEAARAELATTRGELDGARAEAAAAREEAAAAGTRVGMLEESGRRLESELGDARGALERLDAQVEKLRAELGGVRMETEEALDRARAEVAAVVERGDPGAELRHELDEVRAQLTRVVDELGGRLSGIEVSARAASDLGQGVYRSWAALWPSEPRRPPRLTCGPRRPLPRRPARTPEARPTRPLWPRRRPSERRPRPPARPTTSAGVASTSRARRTPPRTSSRRARRCAASPTCSRPRPDWERHRRPTAFRRLGRTGLRPNPILTGRCSSAPRMSASARHAPVSTTSPCRWPRSASTGTSGT